MSAASIEDLKKRGLVLSIIKKKETKNDVCMCYKEQATAIAELFLGKDWEKDYVIEDSAPCIIFADLQVLMAMTQVMSINIPKMAGSRGGSGPGGMFGGGMRPGGQSRSMFGGMSKSDDDDDEEDENEDEDKDDKDDDPDDAA